MYIIEPNNIDMLFRCFLEVKGINKKQTKNIFLNCFGKRKKQIKNIIKINKRCTKECYKDTFLVLYWLILLEIYKMYLYLKKHIESIESHNIHTTLYNIYINDLEILTFLLNFLLDHWWKINWVWYAVKFNKLILCNRFIMYESW